MDTPAVALADSTPASTAGLPLNTTTPAIQLATGSVMVIAVRAVGRVPPAKALCTRTVPTAVEATRPAAGQPNAAAGSPRRDRSSPANTRNTAVIEKQTPAATASATVRACGRGRSNQAVTSKSTTSPAATTTTGHRC